MRRRKAWIGWSFIAGDRRGRVAARRLQQKVLETESASTAPSHCRQRSPTRFAQAAPAKKSQFRCPAWALPFQCI
jgi:hypothetical protein